MKEEIKMSNLTRNTITSMEVAEMVGKEHSKLLRDIRNYVSQLAEAKIGLGDFFTEATYKDANNQNRPCFQVTKKGCEFIAHKLTGQKGTEFTARYINRFHEMEDGKLPCPLNPIIASSVAELGRVTDRIMTKQGSAPYKIAEAFKRYAFEEADHASRFAELLGEVVTNSTKRNLELRAEAEFGACDGKMKIAKRAKELGLDAVHDTVHEMAKDEARHGRGFDGLLARYFA